MRKIVLKTRNMLKINYSTIGKLFQVKRQRLKKMSE